MPSSPSASRDICHQLTLYFAVTYTIQRLILQAKAQRLAASPQQGINDPGTRTPTR